MTRARRIFLTAFVGAVVPLLSAAPAAAHPLGNFTVNRFSAIEVFPDHVVVHYVVDMAEVPTFQELSRIDTDGDNRATSAELEQYAFDRGNEIINNVSLHSNGDPVPLVVDDARAGLSSGQGGIDVLRIDIRFTGPLEESTATLKYADRNFADRLGWKEVVAYGTGGQGIANSTVPSVSASNELRAYPRDLLSSPVEVTTATIKVAPGVAPARSDRPIDLPQAGPGDLFAGAFASLIEGDMTPAFLALAVLLAAGAGALHALGPGHGKTVMAAYLVGSDGRVRHAVMVGVAISLMHTTSVVLLGVITLWASSLFPPETVYPYLSLISGAAVLFFGIWLLWSRLRPHLKRGDAHVHDHADHHEHNRPRDNRLGRSLESEHVHSHAVGHAHGTGYHTHGPHPTAQRSPLSWKGLVALALSGGLLPSPTALVVLLGAVALHRVAFGVTLVAAFSVGLAGALTLLGVVVLRARGYAAERLGSRGSSFIPIGSAAVILAMGAVLTTRAAFGF